MSDCDHPECPKKGKYKVAVMRMEIVKVCKAHVPENAVVNPNGPGGNV